jgi:hypothetical protein
MIWMEGENRRKEGMEKRRRRGESGGESRGAVEVKGEEEKETGEGKSGEGKKGEGKRRK